MSTKVVADHLSGHVVSHSTENSNDTTPILRLILPNEKPKYWLHESDLESMLDILDKMYLFDYYIVSKKYGWLVSEEHNGILIAVGKPVSTKLESYKANND